MFISRKRWSELERRVSELEKQVKPDAVTMSQVKNEMKVAFERAASSASFRPIDSGGFRDCSQSTSIRSSINNRR